MAETNDEGKKGKPRMGALKGTMMVLSLAVVASLCMPATLAYTTDEYLNELSAETIKEDAASVSTCHESLYKILDGSVTWYVGQTEGDGRALISKTFDLIGGWADDGCGSSQGNDDRVQFEASEAAGSGHAFEAKKAGDSCTGGKDAHVTFDVENNFETVAFSCWADWNNSGALIFTGKATLEYVQL